VVFVPGAWADGSSWGTVINGVAEAGLGVICGPIRSQQLFAKRFGERPLHLAAVLEHRFNAQEIDRLKLIIERSVSGRISNRKRFMRRQAAFS
jgi:hypothetical protein